MCRKQGKVVSISGYFSLTKPINANINFMHINSELDPHETTYFPIMASQSTNPKYAKLNTEGYAQCDEAMPVGYYFFNFSYIRQ